LPQFRSPSCCLRCTAGIFSLPATVQTKDPLASDISSVPGFRGKNRGIQITQYKKQNTVSWGLQFPPVGIGGSPGAGLLAPGMAALGWIAAITLVAEDGLRLVRVFPVDPVSAQISAEYGPVRHKYP